MDDLAPTSLRVRAAFSSAVQTSAASLWVPTLQLTTCRVHRSITLAKQHHPFIAKQMGPVGYPDLIAMLQPAQLGEPKLA